MENVTYVEQLQKERVLVPNQGAPNVTHSKDFKHERIGAHHVDEVALRILQVKQRDAEQCPHENSAKTCGFHAKNERT